MFNRKLRSQAGFTLLEILLVVIIIGMLVGVAVVKLGGKGAEAKVITTKRQIDAYKTALGLYELDNGFFPTTEQGLQALVVQSGSPPAPTNWKGPYLDPPVIKKDQWGREFIYKCPGSKLPSTYDLYSLGPKGVEGDEENIGNWNM
jgi:general secretion pathway protein G